MKSLVLRLPAALLKAHRIALRLVAGPLRAPFKRCYGALAWGWATYLTWRERGAAAYARGSLIGRDLLPGLSDIDVAVVLHADPDAPGRAAARVRERWTRARRLSALVDALFNYPLILERDELAEVADESILTLGLDGD